jgi:hypothetical protein
MIRTIAAAFFSAVVVLGFVTAQTQQQQKTTTTQQTDTNTSTPTTNYAAPVDPLEPIVEPVGPEVQPTVEPAVEPTVEPADEAAVQPRTGEKDSKLVTISCPIHPEVKTRSAGKCPVCRLEERKLAAAREKDGTPTAQPAPETTVEPDPEPTLEPVTKPTPLVSPTREPVESEPLTTETSQPIP